MWSRTTFTHDTYEKNTQKRGEFKVYFPNPLKEKNNIYVYIYEQFETATIVALPLGTRAAGRLQQ